MTRNILDILVTLETSQESKGWLNKLQKLNIFDISVTSETSQSFKLFIVVIDEQRLNNDFKLFVPVKFNVSLTELRFKLLQPAKLNPKLPNCRHPHWETPVILSLSPVLLKLHPTNVPVIVIV